MQPPLANVSYGGHRESPGYRLAYKVKCQRIYLRIILQKVAGESLVFEEGRRGDAKLRPGAGGFSHHDQESHYDGQEQESRSEIKSAPRSWVAKSILYEDIHDSNYAGTPWAL
jgi:hypothetical protein